MNMWIGKIKGYNLNGEYIGTYRAEIKEEGNYLFRMTLYFDAINNRCKNPYQKRKYVSSNIEVLKRKFRTSLPTKAKEKAITLECNFQIRQNLSLMAVVQMMKQ